MPTQKWCSVNGCEKFIFASLSDFHEYGWSAFQIPAGKGKALCFCPDHQKEMKDEMEKRLISMNK